MKAVCIVIGMTGLLVAAIPGQGATPGSTQSVTRATNTVMTAPVKEAPVASTQAVVALPAAVPEAPSQTVVRVLSAPVATPFMTNFTARTTAGITNALIRWGAWASGEKKDGAVQFPTERAVAAALTWLQREQQADGSWKGSQEIVTPNLTVLALLAFLGHGETPASAGYGTNVWKAIQWLLANQEESGRFKGRDERNYTQPMAALALAEAYGMTLAPDIKAAATKAVALIVKGQHPSGGFSYSLDKAARDDTSYMSWCAQALVVARMTGLEVPGLERAIDKTVYAVCQNADPNGGFGESGPGRTSFSSAGVVGLQFLGSSGVAEAQKTLEILATNTFLSVTAEALPFPGASRFYTAWNLTQVRFLAGGDAFRSWNKSLARELVGSQTRQRNLLTKWADLGHWEQRSTDPKEVMIQDTCYGALMLEVYYRYLPLGK